MRGEILWLDMEMTGLEPDVDRPLEVAAVATDWNFKTVAEFCAGIAQPAEVISPLLDANPFYKKFPKNKRSLLELCALARPLAEVERQLLDFAAAHFDTGQPLLLAGNSVHQDRRFIRQYFPRLERLLHYRMLDVSAWKVVFESKYGLKFAKKETHRAVDDIQESIAELKFYLKQVKTGKPVASPES
ncbi:MAG: oligoribonuclease [Candidatus Chaera renei]|uniref:Oligoribonuclease n=1 Tax=Candidatus Chaera renei TaxID=2506947 RepID=A0A4Q0AJX6_9BACT|nr:MAG: oligoribonuclease [Candidatus Chaera renei]